VSAVVGLIMLCAGIAGRGSLAITGSQRAYLAARGIETRAVVLDVVLGAPGRRKSPDWLTVKYEFETRSGEVRRKRAGEQVAIIRGWSGKGETEDAGIVALGHSHADRYRRRWLLRGARHALSGFNPREARAGNRRAFFSCRCSIGGRYAAAVCILCASHPNQRITWPEQAHTQLVG
jgi:hypothetical protein